MKNWYWLVLGLLWSGIANAQVTVKGTVTDKSSGETLPGVNIVEKGKTTGTSTDATGKYSLTVSSDTATLIFQFLGYGQQEFKLNGNTTMDVKLVPANINLDEFVVTALGISRETKDLGYAVQKLEPKDVSEVKGANFVDNLAGKLAGVTISQGATGVGSTSKIVIRGESSFTNNNPLFVVDGVIINNNSVLNFTNDAAAGFQEVDFGNGAMDINPDDVASVSVLKGPAAAALYGTRASNGVIIITTKAGAMYKKPRISFNTTTFIDRPFQLPQFQNSYGQGNSGQFEYVDGLGGGTNDNISYSWGPATDQGTMISQFDSPVTLADGTVVRGGDVAVHGGAPITQTPFVSYPDNLKNFYRTGVTTINNLSVAQGFNQGNFRLSYTDLRSVSTIPGVNLDRNTLSGKFIFEPTEKLSLSSSLNYVRSSSDNRPSSGYGSENINYSLVAWGPRSLNIEALEDYWQPGLEDVQQYSFNYTYFDNPYFILLENRNSFNRDRLFGNIMARYLFSEHLTMHVRTGMDYSNELREFRRSFSSNRFISGAYARGDVNFREINTDVLLTYRNKIKHLTYEASVGGNRMDQQASTAQTQATTLAQPGVFNLSNAASPLEVFEYANQKRINSVYGILKLGYKEFLYVDVTGRNDWSSALATPTSTDNTSFFYPSVSTSIITSRILSLPEWISFSKIRLSWAQVGNDTDPYQTTGAFIAQTPYLGQPTFSDQNIIANANLLPEQKTAVELGGDVRFLEDRIRLDVTYYNALTENQIISLPVAVSSGYDQQVINGGAVRSEGIEIMLGATPVVNEDYKWNTMFNFSHNVSTVEELPENAGTLTLAYSRVYDNVNQTVWFQVEEGGRIGEMYGTGYLQNENGDYVIDDNGRYVVDNELRLLGNYNPDFILGWSNNLQYKNFDFSFLFDWRHGGVLVSRTLSLAAVGGQLIETEDRPDAGIVAEGVVNTGTESEPVWEPNTTAVSAESYYRQYYDRNHEENNVYDASYLKLRQFSIGYTFEGKEEATGWFTEGRSLTLSFIGRNLFAISEIPHFDPEQLAVQGTQFVSGVEDMSYPTSRSFGFKASLNF